MTSSHLFNSLFPLTDGLQLNVCHSKSNQKPLSVESFINPEFYPLADLNPYQTSVPEIKLKCSMSCVRSNCQVQVQSNLAIYLPSTNFQHPSAILLPSSYHNSTSILLASFQHLSLILLASFQHPSSILLASFQHPSSILLASF